MNRRVFLTMAGGAGCAALNGQVPAGGSRPMIIELRQLFLRNTQDAMVQRTNDFLSKTVLPALQRVGVQPAGAFTNLIGESSPYVLLVSQYATLAAWEDASRKMAEDTEYQK
ncbi:MAG TPA: hypothetical protein VEQ63_13165, partial [Bryobacteraceae bacterium]|nr:hypothetical protein [Bryobacteraceae bacterium]